MTLLENTVKAIQEQSAAAIASRKSPGTAFPPPPSEQADIDIAAKFRKYSLVPVIHLRGSTSGIDGNVPSTILVPRRYLTEHKISIDEFHRHCLLKHEWNLGDEVIDGLIVDAKNDGAVFLSPRGEEHSNKLEESGSSAHVALVLGRDGEVEVHKTCSHDGIDGNGRPWLKTQHQFLESSAAVKKTDIFVKPLRLTEADGTVSIVFPYIKSHTLSEMVFAGMGASSLLNVIVDMLGDMTTRVWSEGVCNAPANFIEQAHFSRIRRRVEIARAQVPELDEVASYESITLNGRRLLGFERVLKALSSHSRIGEITPRTLSEIHGDLNIQNILCQLDPDAERPVILIDPRGVPLLDKSAGVTAFEPGDYCYDLAKLKFSLSGFAEIRKGLYSFQREGQSFKLVFQSHPGSDTMIGADRGFFAAISSNKRLTQYIDAVEPSGLQSMELRLLLGEAAHFVADAACALGRDKSEEVLPLFTAGIEKLNDVLELIQGKGDSSIATRKLSTETAVESPSYGAAMMQSTLLGLGSPDARWSWDVLEVLVKSESTTTAQQLLRELVGNYLPEGTEVHVSTHPAAAVKFPCVLIHPFNGVRGQTHAVLSGVRRTSTFLRGAGVSQEKIGGLRVVTITSTGASTGSQLTSRQNDRLLSPGPWGVSPLKLSALQANQLVFPGAGRWIIENDSFFVISRALSAGGDGLCLLTSKRGTTNSNSSWSVCIGSTEEIDGRTFATDIGPNEEETKMLRPTSAIFMPNHLGQSLGQKEEDYATRTSSLLIDVVLPRFMERAEWIQLCHARGFGVNSDLAWNNAKQLADLSPKVELAHGGDEMEFHHFGSDSEYNKLVDGVGRSPWLNSAAYLPSMAKWVRRRVGPTSSERSSRVH